MFLTHVCSALNRAKVGYAVVSGFAVALHGAVRGTIDLDLILSLDEDSFVRAEDIFQKLGLKSRLPVDAKEVFQFRQEYIKNRNLVAWGFYDPRHPASQLDIIITHNFRKIKYDVMTVAGVKINVISIIDLIAMKKKSGRAQDLEDVKALESILKYDKT